MIFNHNKINTIKITKEATIFNIIQLKVTKNKHKPYQEITTSLIYNTIELQKITTTLK